MFEQNTKNNRSKSNQNLKLDTLKNFEVKPVEYIQKLNKKNYSRCNALKKLSK